jgi:hypothetical protein
MFKLVDYKMFEAEDANPKVNQIKNNLKDLFNQISELKKSTKSGDPNSEIISLTKQSDIYQKISNSMKLLVVEMKKPQPENKAKLY